MAKLPELKTKREAREFWDTHDLTDYLKELELVTEEIFVQPRGKQQIFSIRMERHIVELLRKLATQKGLEASSLVRSWIMERLQEELKTKQIRKPS